MDVNDIFKDVFKLPVSNWKYLIIFGLITLSYALFLGLIPIIGLIIMGF